MFEARQSYNKSLVWKHSVIKKKDKAPPVGRKFNFVICMENTQMFAKACSYTACMMGTGIFLEIKATHHM